MSSVQLNKGVSNINNLNIVTFIKDIYQSLKHIDQSFSIMKTDIDARMTKLEMNQQVILERIANLETFLSQINTKITETEKIDKSIENELLDKMFYLNRANEDNSKIELKTKELTIANIVENGYTLLDINKTILESNESSLDSYSNEYKPLDLTDDSNSFTLTEPLLESNHLNNKPGSIGNGGVVGNKNLDSLLFD